MGGRDGDAAAYCAVGDDFGLVFGEEGGGVGVCGEDEGTGLEGAAGGLDCVEDFFFSCCSFLGWGVGGGDF